MPRYIITELRNPETGLPVNLWVLINRIGNLHIKQYFENLGEIYITNYKFVGRETYKKAEEGKQ